MITPVLKEYKTGNLKGTIIENGINYELYKVDGGSQIALTFEDKSYKTPDVGGYRLQANLEDGTSIEREFTVIQKDITINALNQSAGAGNVSSYPPTLELDESTPMAFDENLGILKLAITVRNTADKIITLNDETDPGSYTIIGNPSDLTLAGKYNNYNVTFVEGTYTIIGATYEVTMEAIPYQGRDVGTIELSVNNRAPLENEKFSASTALLFIAKPYEGYQVDQWNITKTDGGTPITDFTELTPNIISYILKSENTHVEVSFKKAEITLDIIKEGKGSVKASDPAFVSGAIVGTGAEIDFMATAEEGYTFKEWRIEAGTTKVEQGTLNDDGSNTLKFTMGGNSTRLNAIFVRDSYKLNLSENLEAVYKYKDIDDNELEKVVYDGALIVGDTSVAVRVKAGYELAEGAKWLVNDAEVVVDPSTGYIFNIAEDTTVLVDTVQQFYTLTTESANGSYR